MIRSKVVTKTKADNWGKVEGLIRGFGTKIQVGILKGSGSVEGTTIADIAFWNEFGTERIPERPFLRSTYAEQKKTVLSKLAKALKQVLKGKNLAIEFGKVGQWYEDRVKETITNLSDPPNAESTKRIKKSSNPLIDTGRMRATVRHEVVQ
jgi:hypothetical protein